MKELLNDNQLLIIMQGDTLFDSMMPFLKGNLQAALTDFQIRAGNTYNEGPWKVPATGETYTNPDCLQPPTLGEVSALLGEAYLALPDKNPLKLSLRTVMGELGLPPVATKVNPRGKISPKEP